MAELPAAIVVRRMDDAIADPEFRAAARGLCVGVALVVEDAVVTLSIGPEACRWERGAVGDADIRIVARAEAWARVLGSRPPPRHQSFTALQLVNPDVDIVGDPLRIAQARPALERLLELLREPGEAPGVAPGAEAVARSMGQIVGRYASIRSHGAAEALDVYWEEAGRGPPVLCLHTAGADARQYGAILADVALAERWRLLAFDLPFHGRSMPPFGWDGGAYRLDQRRYLSWVGSFIETVIREPVVLVGCSMGAAIALVMAAERPELLRGVVALEPPLRSPGRRNPFLAHAAVAGGLHNSAYVRGLMSPTSPEAWRRRAAWIYAQGGPGVYAGDLGFYSDEFDGHAIAAQIDTDRVPVHLLTGEYDYSATVEDGEALSHLISGATFRTMPGLGHFPMSENPDLFRGYLVQALDTFVR